MIYTDKTKIAMNIAYKAHMNQFDDGGVPYIYHPIHVAEAMNDEKSCIVALLHDVVEDTTYTLEDLSEYFDEDIINALRVITKGKNEDYMVYINKVKENEIAKKVKIVDLIHNKNLDRIDNVSEENIERVKKYDKALECLLEK